MRRSFLSLKLLILVAAGLPMNGGAQVPDLPPEVLHFADTVFYNGQVLTADADRDFTIAEAVAVRDGRFLAVGDSADVLRYAGPGTRRIDLDGRSLTPGFIYSDGDNAVPGGDLVKDSQWGGTIQPQIGGRSLEEVEQTMIHIVENEALPGEIVYIKVTDQWAGPLMETWDRYALDEISPENPTLLLPDCCHAIANSRLLEMMIDAGFPEDHLHLIRDSRGEPTGQLGSLAVGFVGRELRPTPPPEWIEQFGITRATDKVREYAREGITTATGHMTGLTVLILNRIYKSGDLVIRVFPALDLLRQNAFPERTLKRVGNLMDFALFDERGPMVQIVGTSVGPHSGAPDAAISLMTIEPKTNIIPELGRSAHGYDRWSAEYFTGKSTAELNDRERADTEFHNVLLGRQYGYNVNGVHDMGSGGIMLAMQTIVAAESQENLYVPELSRAQALDHNIDWIDANFEYFREHEDILSKYLRVGVSLDSALDQRSVEIYGIDNVITAQYGWEGVERLAPLKSLLEAGIPFHIEGTDPRTPPLFLIKGAVMRVDRDGNVVAPDEALTREEALLALTRWAARFISAEEYLGSIEPGHYADLVVFDGDIMTVPIAEIDSLSPVLTMVGGEIVYER